MSLLTVPPEILQQILGESVLYPNFPALRLVHSHLNTRIILSAKILTRTLIAKHVVSDHIFGLYSLANLDTGYPSGGEFLTFLNLCNDVVNFGSLQQILESNRKKLTDFPIWSGVPSSSFCNVESMLLFSAFHRQLERCSDPIKEENSTNTVLMASQGKEKVIRVKLHQSFLNFLRMDLTVEDFDRLMTIVDFCAVSPRFTPANLNPSQFYESGLHSDHWQNEQLGSALLAECILWKGTTWLYKMINRDSDRDGMVIVTEQHSRKDEQTMWLGSRGEAMRLAANGIARLLWKERTSKIECEKAQASAGDTDAPLIMQEHRFDPALWRGSSGGM